MNSSVNLLDSDTQYAVYSFRLDASNRRHPAIASECALGPPRIREAIRQTSDKRMKDTTNKNFWDHSARIYDRFMRTDAAAYDEIVRLIRTRLSPDMEVLELATGTGLIALQIADCVKSIEATDFSDKMLAVARGKPAPPNVRFSRQDATRLTYPNRRFDAVVIANALHVMPHPESALSEIHRVLKDDGILIAPTFTHKGLSFFSRIKSAIMKRFGFGVFYSWSPQEYIAFIDGHEFIVRYSSVLESSFPLTYAEAGKRMKR